MATAKKYFHDRMVLLLLSVNGFLTILATLSVLLRLQGGTEVFIAEYRENIGVSNAFKQGQLGQLLVFIAFAVLVFAVHAVLSHRVYEIRRQLALLVLALGSLLLVMTVIVANALLALH